MQYRAEIDGLRALAVVPVILFHAGFQLFSGGFVGVDVFFVISGYLITNIILTELKEERFSISRFYERRARRILPALFFVVFVSMPFAGMWFMPSDLRDYSDSLIGVATFTSNILFWKESGYFAATAELKPLLHTWSLAVEEQFYVFFPLFMMLAWRFGQRFIVMLLIFVFIGSLGFAQWATIHEPAMAFYLWPTRSWELAIGTFLAFYLNNKKDSEFSLPLQQVGSFVGAGFILFSVFYFDQRTPFPGVHALVPTIGAALIILFARPQTIVWRILSNPLFVGIGLISFSAYLWHQPMFAYAKYISTSHPPVWLMGLLCFASFGLAYCSWKFVETPFRDRSKVASRRLAKIAVVSGLSIILIGVVGRKTDGFEHVIAKYRLNEEQAARYSIISRDTKYGLRGSMVNDGNCRFWAPVLDFEFKMKFKKCAERYGKSVVVLGDSHGMNLYNAFAKTEIIPFLVGIVKGGCRPHDEKTACPYKSFKQFARDNGDKVRVILFHQSGSYFVKDARGNVDSQYTFDDGRYSFSEENIEDVKAYLIDLDKETDTEVLWVGPFVEYRYDPKDAVYRTEFLKVNPISEDIFSALGIHLAKTVKVKPSVPFVPFEQIYATPKSAIVEGCFIFYDNDHFSRCGEDLMAKAESVRVFLQQFD